MSGRGRREGGTVREGGMARGKARVKGWARERAGGMASAIACRVPGQGDDDDVTILNEA